MGQWVFQLQEANGFYEDFNYEEQAIEHETNGKIKGKQNEYSHLNTGIIGKREIYKSEKFRSIENTSDSVHQEATPF